jgi:hypothetical protein
LIFLGLLTTPLTTTRADVLITIKGKDLMQHPPSMKGGSTQGTLINFASFTMFTSITLKSVKHLKKKIEKLIFR